MDPCSDAELEEPVQQLRCPKRTVTWQIVNGACDELLKRQSPVDAQVALQKQRRFDYSRVALGALSIICELCCCFGQQRERPERRKRLTDQPGKCGYLWKLNAGCGEDPEELSNLRNWRRRFFVLKGTVATKHCPSKVSMLYLSEKCDGQMTLACALSSSEASESFSPLPQIDTEPPSPGTRYWARSNLQQYDVAFGLYTCKEATAYDNNVPDQLCPFKIRWMDSQACEHYLVLAAPSENVRAGWLAGVKNKVAELRERERAKPPRSRWTS